VEVRILVEKWNIYEAHIFPRSLIQTCWLETIPLCLCTRLSLNKKFPNFHYFNLNSGNGLTFVCSPPSDKNIRTNFSWNLRFGIDMFTFDTYVILNISCNFVNVQKKNFNFKNTWPINRNRKKTSNWTHFSVRLPMFPI
jgi:hypothetical protein